MLNFTQEIKRELLRSVPETRQGKLSLLYGALSASGRVTGEGIAFTSESESVAGYLLSLTEGTLGVRMTLTEAAYDPKHGRDKLTFTLPGSYRGETVSPAADEECARAFLKGAFLGGGSCTLPRAGKKTGYHLEFEFPSAARAEKLLEALDFLQFFYNLAARGERALVYIKSREAISDFLSAMGAEGALGKLNEVSAERDANNAENRAINCSAGNADRAAIASVEQVKALAALKESGRLSLFPEPLQEAARVRLDHPGYTLSELAALLGLTKSGYSHRLRKLMELAEERE